MNKITLTLAAIALVATGFVMSRSSSAEGALKIGDKAPMTDYEMKNIDGKSHSMKSLKKENGLLVIFSCNTCPYVVGWEDSYSVLGDLSERLNIGMVLVNSNEAFRGDEDSPEAMAQHYKDAGYNTPYVIDTDHKLADAFGARTTPHVYLFDGDMKLVYTGSINDKYENKEKKATKDYLISAMRYLTSSSAADINPKVTKHIGCSIKRKKG